MNTREPYDLVIVGAGPVGATLALAAARLGFSVALVEKTIFDSRQQPAFDERHLGFSRSTKLALDAMGIWSAMESEASSIGRIHVSAQGQFGSVVMRPEDEKLDSLGYVLPARVMGSALAHLLEEQEGIAQFSPATLQSVSHADGYSEISLLHADKTVTLNARLLVGADGTDSAVRQLHEIGISRTRYHQGAVIANLDASDVEPGLAYERFIDRGVLALLPLGDNGYAVVCSVTDEKAEQVMAMDDEQFIGFVTGSFNGRLPTIMAVSRRRCYPLALIRADQVTGKRMVLVGNAAHFIHPVAAQGFNLSIRDITALIELLVLARRAGESPGAEGTLEAYARWRRQDEAIMVAFTDGLVRLSTSPLSLAALLRQKAMLGLRYCPGLRRTFTRAVTGRLGRQSGLMRGLELSDYA